MKSSCCAFAILSGLIAAEIFINASLHWHVIPARSGIVFLRLLFKLYFMEQAMRQFDLLRKKISWVAAAAFLIPFSVYGADQQTCDVRLSTQVDLNQCAADALHRADNELNRVYQAVLKQHSDDRELLEKLRKAQRAWLMFRDAELEARFPAKEKQSYYGSVFPMCAAQFMAHRTQERIKQLKEWLKGTEEGDLCAGSIPIKPPN